MSKPVNIKLASPVKESGVELTHVTMREPTVRDQVTVQKDTSLDEAMREIHLFANLCEVIPDTILALSMKDYGQLQTAYKSFL